MAEVRVARAGDVDCGADGDEYEYERVDGWCGVLVADRDYRGIVVAAVRIRR